MINTRLDADVSSRLTAFHGLLRVLSLLPFLPAIFFVFLAFITPLTWSGLLYLVGVVAVIIGIFAVVWGFSRYKLLLWAGVALIITVAVVRLILLNTAAAKIKLLTLPAQTSFCLVNCLIDEQDAALVSTHLLPLIGWISPTEQNGLLDAMSAGYHAESSVQSLPPSPFVRTYLGLQHSDAFDAVVIEPDTNQPAQTGLIFLHGFTGNFTMPCWLVAQSIPDSLTVCPSIGWKGDWWTSNGEATLRQTIDYIHQRGINRIYLAGLANGAVGASELAYKLTSDIAGLILISGASPDAKDSGLPVLVLSGTQDERMPVDMMRVYANRMGTNATFIALDSDHFMLAKKDKEIQKAINTWLHQH